MSIRTILVDDEKLAIQGLELRLQPFDDIEIVAICRNGREAIRKIKTLKPDLVFLDIQMPGFDGFSVVQGVMDIDPPLFVFVTAYSEHAIKAFEAQAIDYLMKPVEPERLADTMDRVRGQIFRVDVASIERIDAAGDYMCIYTADNSLILRETMKDLEKRLDPRTFQRVHRSTIVNLDQVRQVKPHTNGECFLVLESGAQVKVSRSYRDVVARFVH